MPPRPLTPFLSVAGGANPPKPRGKVAGKAASEVTPAPKSTTPKKAAKSAGTPASTPAPKPATPKKAAKKPARSQTASEKLTEAQIQDKFAINIPGQQGPDLSNPLQPPTSVAPAERALQIFDELVSADAATQPQSVSELMNIVPGLSLEQVRQVNEKAQRLIRDQPVALTQETQKRLSSINKLMQLLEPEAPPVAPRAPLTVAFGRFPGSMAPVQPPVATPAQVSPAYERLPVSPAYGRLPGSMAPVQPPFVQPSGPYGPLKQPPTWQGNPDAGYDGLGSGVTVPGGPIQSRNPGSMGRLYSPYDIAQAEDLGSVGNNPLPKAGAAAAAAAGLAGGAYVLSGGYPSLAQPVETPEQTTAGLQKLVQFDNTLNGQPRQQVHSVPAVPNPRDIHRAVVEGLNQGTMSREQAIATIESARSPDGSLPYSLRGTRSHLRDFDELMSPAGGNPLTGTSPSPAPVSQSLPGEEYQPRFLDAFFLPDQAVPETKRVSSSYTPPERRAPHLLSLGAFRGPAVGLASAVQTGQNLAGFAEEDLRRGVYGSARATPVEQTPRAASPLGQTPYPPADRIDALVSQSRLDNPMPQQGGVHPFALPQREYPAVARARAEASNRYDTRFRPGGEFNPGTDPIGADQMARIRANEQYRQGSMTTPSGLVGRFGRGGPMGLDALAMADAERQMEQQDRLRARVQADQDLINASNPLTEQGAANVSRGFIPAATDDPFQRQSRTFAFQREANRSAANPLGTTGTNQLGMLRMMRAQAAAQGGSLSKKDATTLEVLESQQRARDSIKQSPERRELVRDALRERGNRREDQAFSRYLKQGYSPTDPFLQQRFPGAVQRWADRLPPGQRKLYGYDDQASASQDMTSPLNEVTVGGQVSPGQVLEANTFIQAVHDPTQSLDSIPGGAVFDAIATRSRVGREYLDVGTINAQLEQGLADDLMRTPGSLVLGVDELKALKTYAQANYAAGGPQQKAIDSSPALVALLGVDLDGLSLPEAMQKMRETAAKYKQRTKGIPSDGMSYEGTGATLF